MYVLLDAGVVFGVDTRARRISGVLIDRGLPRLLELLAIGDWLPLLLGIFNGMLSCSLSFMFFKPVILLPEGLSTLRCDESLLISIIGSPFVEF